MKWPFINLTQLGSVILILILLPVAALACKYSVRDVGFVALDQHDYLLRLIVSDKTSSESLEILHTQLKPILRDTNISVEILKQTSSELSVEQQKQVFPEGQAAAWLIDEFPVGKTIPTEPRALFLQNISYTETNKLTPFIWELASSKMREKLIDTLLKTHSGLLIVESSNQAYNEKAFSVAEAAQKEINTILPDLPKPVEFPPEIIRISLKDRPTENVLLWSLGIDIQEDETTYLIPLFGRGRMLGKPLEIPGTSLTELLTILGYVGQDCECELDRSWMQGKMFPHRWDEHIEDLAAKGLGFDPGSPVVKTEITRILARGPSGRRNLQAGNVTSDDLINLDQEPTGEVSAKTANDILRELNILTDDSTPEEPETSVAENGVKEPVANSPVQDKANENPETSPPKPPEAEVIENSQSSYSNYFELAFVFLAVVVLWIVLRGRNRG